MNKERGRSELGRALSGLYNQMAYFYRIELLLKETPTKPGSWKLKLVTAPGIRAKSLSLTYPHKLMPCQVGASEP